MLDTEWNQYKALMRRKYRKNPVERERLEGWINWFENSAGKLDVSKWMKFVKTQGKKMTSEEKQKIIDETEMEIKKNKEEDSDAKPRNEELHTGETVPTEQVRGGDVQDVEPGKPRVESGGV